MKIGETLGSPVAWWLGYRSFLLLEEVDCIQGNMLMIVL